jgi:hypothetical protein
MNVSRTPVSVKYWYVPYAVRFLGGGSGIFLIMFSDFWFADWLIGCHFGLAH